MRTLYLLGNGFDIAHDIDTHYSSFRKFLSLKHEEFLTKFESMYHIQPLDDTEPWYSEEDQKRWNNNVIKNLWCRFEEDIGNPDVTGMYDAALALVSTMPSEGVSDTLDAHWRDMYSFVDCLQKYVFEWLNTIDVSACPCKKQSLVDANSDYYINFNYTDTLEKVYKINNVLHIHGSISDPLSIPPIMGHGNRFLIDQNKDMARKYYKEGIEWAYSAHKAIANFVESLYKDVDKIIANNDEFFSNLFSFNKVICFGLSFSDIDVPYLERIRNEINPKTEWIVYYHNEMDRKRLKDVFSILNITSRFNVYFLHSSKFWED